MHPRSLTVQISAAGDDPPTGFVLADEEPPAPFAGWLELMQTIERLARSPSLRVVSPGEQDLLIHEEGALP